MKIISSQILAVMALFVFTVSGQVLVPGTCVNHSVVQNFRVNSYLGTWYEIENTFAAYEVNATCVAADYSDFGNGSIRVLNSQINAESGEPGSILGSAKLADPSKNEAKLLVTFPNTGSFEAPYWVLDTDYTSYAIVWSCRTAQYGLNSLQTFWFLSRTRTTTEFRHGYVHGYLSALDFDVSTLEETVQTNCPEHNTNNLID